MAGAVLALGVDRLDYTKGIPERFRGIERFLEKHPSYQGRFTHIQIGAPSRTHIHRYQDLIADVEAEAERIRELHPHRRCVAGPFPLLAAVALVDELEQVRAAAARDRACLIQWRAEAAGGAGG